MDFLTFRLYFLTFGGYSMELLLSGTDFPHEPGEFSKPKQVGYYGVFCFTTAFVYEKDGILCRGEAGDLLINPPGSIIHHGPAEASESFRNHWMHISADFGQLLQRYPLPLNTAFPLKSQGLIPAAIRKLNHEQFLKRPGWQEAVDCILIQTVIELHRLWLQGPERTPEVRLEEARNTFLGAPERPWTLEEMARLSGYSPSRFIALYTACYGTSPKAELLQARLSMAKQMLAYSDLSITAIANACGFQSVYYFSKYFRKQTGLPPSQWKAGR
jgi:AraC-like DNA-binding protein